MLAHRLGAARTTAEPDAVQEIIQRCARLPLALGIAAARAAARPEFPLAETASDLRRATSTLDALHGGDHASDVRYVFSISYRTLSPASAALFRRLGLHPGPDVGLPAAASLAGVEPHEVRPRLDELVQARFVTESRPGRYSFHDLLRSYAIEQAHREDDAAARHTATLRIVDHYLHSA